MAKDGRDREKLGSPCPSCKTNIPFGTMRCPRCKEWNFSSGDEAEQEVVRLSDARISIVPRLPTFHPEMDKFFGGGLVQTSTMLLGAEPGFGKSTLTLQLADFLIDYFRREHGEKRNVVMVANEQSPDEIRAKAIELGIVHMHEICILKAMGGFSGNLFEIISRYKPCLTVIDSLSKLVGRDPDLAVIVASMMKELSVKLNMPTLMINQVTKDLNHAGQEKLQHEVDMTALGTTIGNKRVLESEKNRNGQAPLALAMTMKGPEDFAAGRGGLQIMGIVEPPDEEGEEEEDGEPVARIGEDSENVPGPKRLKK